MLDLLRAAQERGPHTMWTRLLCRVLRADGDVPAVPGKKAEGADDILVSREHSDSRAEDILKAL